MQLKCVGSATFAVLVKDWVSQSSARQRAGRTGRQCPGVCVRLYTREFHDALPAHDVPEMLRLPLDRVVLQVRVRRCCARAHTTVVGGGRRSSCWKLAQSATSWRNLCRCVARSALHAIQTMNCG